MRILRIVFLLAPAVILLWLALPRFFGGLALDATFPVPAGMATNRVFGRETYARTAAVLAVADPADGETQLLRAQAIVQSGAPALVVRPMVERALGQAPASIQGWMLLAEVSLGADPEAAARALEVAIDLSPQDYWLVGRKARAGAQLWDRLDAEARPNLLYQARQIWAEPSLRSELLPLIRVQGGSALMTRAIARREEIRAINRYISRLRRTRS